MRKGKTWLLLIAVVLLCSMLITILPLNRRSATNTPPKSPPDPVPEETGGDETEEEPVTYTPFETVAYEGAQAGYLTAVPGSAVAFGTQTYWASVYTDVGENDKIKFTTYANGNANADYAVVTDENDIVIQTYYKGLEVGRSGELELTVPEGGKRLYIVIGSGVDAIPNYITIQRSQAFTVFEALEQHGERLNALESTGLPAYYTDEWLNGIYDSIRAETNFVNGVAFAFITDLHFSANAGHSGILLKNILENTSVPYVISGGDYPVAYGNRDELIEQTDKLVEYANFIGKDRFFSVRGNHDFTIRDSAEATTGTTLPYGYTYDAIGRISENWVQSMNPEHLCFYLENKAQKARIICLNSCDGQTSDETMPWGISYKVSAEQVDWLLNDAMNCDGYRFVFISHIPADPAIKSYNSSQDVFHNIFVALKNRTTVTVNGKTVDFSESTNEAICHITGHNHRDISHVDENFLSISTTCDACYSYNPTEGDNIGCWTAKEGTLTEQAFDIFCIDFDNMTVKTIRVGRGENREWSYTVLTD